MTSVAIVANFWTGGKAYWNGQDFSDKLPMKEDCNHRDFQRAIERAPRNTQSIDLVEVDHFDGKAVSLKKETQF